MTRARELADLLTGGQTITTADNTEQLILKSTDADASAGPLVKMHRESGSPADGDALGRFNFIGENDADEEVTYARIHAKANDVTDGTEDGELLLLTTVGGTNRSRMAIGPSETVFNEDSVDVDFRVESDSQTHMLFVDAASELVTIGTNIGSLFNAEGTVAALTVAGSDTSTTTTGNGGAAINISNKDGTAGNTSGIHFSREDNDGNPHYSGAAIVAQFPDAQADGEYPKGRLHFNTSTSANSAPSTKMTILESGNVGIGTASPSGVLHTAGSGDQTVTLQAGGESKLEMKIDGNSDGCSIRFSDSDAASQGQIRYQHSTDALVMYTNGNNERLRVDSSGNVGIGTNNPSGKLHAQTSHTSTDVTAANSNETLVLGNSGAGDGVYNALRFGGNQQDMYIMSFNDSTQADRRLGFFVGSVAGDAVDDERLSILGNGNVLVGTTNPDIYSVSGTGANDTGHAFLPGGLYSQASTGTCFAVNRVGSDGEIISFRQAGSAEGSISVSGSTVSYNGGHLSRWSQATDGNRIDGLVKGTVMTNLDQMAVWTKDGVTEDNEQLNCMAVSSVEGDANVAGVFVNWDDDDEDYTADMNVAMTGDMVIRIASGTTVARGDLLMSAGDGTAKPQDDDIVRSKTIAKVTSTTVSHTYDDGSYLVPCVLMAC